MIVILYSLTILNNMLFNVVGPMSSPTRSNLPPENTAPTQSPASAKFFLDFKADLIEAKQLLNDGMLEEEEHADLKTAARKRYTESKAARQTLLLIEAKRKHDEVEVSSLASDSDTDDHGESCKSRKSTKGPSKGSKVSGDSRQTMDSRGSRSQLRSRSLPHKKVKRFLNAVKIPKEASWLDQVQCLTQLVKEAPNILWELKGDLEDSQETLVQYKNAIPANDAEDGQPFDVWIPSTSQPTDDNITDYECNICKQAVLLGVSHVQVGKVSLCGSEKNLHQIRQYIRQHNTQSARHVDELAKKVIAPEGSSWLEYNNVKKHKAVIDGKKNKRLEKKALQDEDSSVVDQEGRFVALLVPPPSCYCLLFASSFFKRDYVLAL